MNKIKYYILSEYQKKKRCKSTQNTREKKSPNDWSLRLAASKSSLCSEKYGDFFCSACLCCLNLRRSYPLYFIMTLEIEWVRESEKTTSEFFHACLNSTNIADIMCIKTDVECGNALSLSTRANYNECKVFLWSCMHLPECGHCFAWIIALA